jgi:hypothetical protein
VIMASRTLILSGLEHFSVHRHAITMKAPG